MSIKPDWWIREQAKAGMIEPFEDGLVRQGVISYGLTSFGYDLRAAPEWKIFTNVFNTVVDPKNFDPKSFVEYEGEEVIIPPNSFALARSLEYVRMPDTVLAIAVGKSTYARCFSGDTRVALVDGRSLTIEEMAEQADDELFFGYSIGAYGRVMVTLLEAPRFIGRDSLLEIALDNGQRIRATPDHIFLLRDGRTLPAADLQPGTSLMPLYRSLRRGHEMVYQSSNGFMWPTQRLADEWNLRHGLYEGAADTHCHHKDFDRLNNNPWNLERVPASKHIRMHNAEYYGVGFDSSEHGQSVREALERLCQDDAWYSQFRQQQKAKATGFWHDPQYGQTRAALLEKHRERWTEAERQTQRERQANFWSANPERREQVGEHLRAAWASASHERRNRQREIARSIRLREDITPQVVRHALDTTGSIRGAAQYLGVDRSVFRRFPEVIQAFKGISSRKVANHKVVSVRSLGGEHDVYCLTVPEAGNFALEAGVFVHNCGIVANVTPIEPGWEGHITLEFSNTTPLPAKMYANEGVVQLVFFQGERPETTYGDRKGKYQGQRGITLPKI
ncbi:MAG: dCTP deaminase [Thermaceae bacterium]|nr:dCTP deaminase [Thermaceae bacterium]